jgi:hypothetical protein
LTVRAGAAERPGSGSGAGFQFRGAMVTLKVLPCRLPQLLHKVAAT